MIVQLSLGNILSNCRNRGSTLAIEGAKLSVDLGGRTFDHAKRPHDLDRHALHSNAKIMHGPLGLSTPEPLGRDGQWPEGVAFNAGLGGFLARFGHEIRPTPPDVFSLRRRRLT